MKIPVLFAVTCFQINTCHFTRGHLLPLKNDTSYHWRIDEIDDTGCPLATGDVWTFTTRKASAVIRLNNEQPIIDRSFEGVGNNINGPSLIRIPDWIDPADRTDPSAIYYLYFANHGGDNIEKVNFRRGPWLRCVQETIISDHICGFAIILA